MVTKASTRKSEKKDEVAVEAPHNPKPVETFVDHQRKAIAEASRAVESLLPDAAKEHGEAALKEMMEGYRSLFNRTIDEIVETFEKAKIK